MTTCVFHFGFAFVFPWGIISLQSDWSLSYSFGGGYDPTSAPKYSGQEGRVHGAVANADERNDLAAQVIRDAVELVGRAREGTLPLCRQHG